MYDIALRWKISCIVSDSCRAMYVIEEIKHEQTSIPGNVAQCFFLNNSLVLVKAHFKTVSCLKVVAAYAVEKFIDKTD